MRLLPGLARERQERLACHLEAIEPDRLLAPFRRQAGLTPKAETYGGWEAKDIAGHSLGHVLSALAYLHASTEATWILPRIRYVVAELESCQRANGDGYLLPVERSALTALKAGKIESSPFSLNGVWVPFYTLHKVLAGLRDALRLCDLPQALAVARRVADWLEDILSPLDAGQIQAMLSAEHGGMHEVLADLAVDADEPRYLALAERCFRHEAVLAPLRRGEDRLDGLHGNTQIPKVIGLARAYELTGETGQREAVAGFWSNVVHRRSYAIGGHGESEHFFPPEAFLDHLTPNTCETCNTYNLLKLTRHLFSWEPEAAHMDFVERAMLNHLWANLGRQPGEYGYFLGLGAVGVKAFSTPFDSWWCCVGTGMENPVRYGEQLYAHSDEGSVLWVNHYLASELAWPERGLTLRQSTRFPDDDQVRLEFVCRVDVKLTLKLRHPAWCSHPEVGVNGHLHKPVSKPSSYLAIERTWRSGDTLDLRLPMTLRLEPLPHSGGRIASVMFGPLVLAAVVPPEPGAVDPAKERFRDHLASRGKTDAFPPVFAACDEAAVLAGLQPTGRHFAEFRSVGVVRPADLSFVPFHRLYEEHYAVYLPRMTEAEWASEKEVMRERQTEEKAKAAATVDSVTPGYQQPEVEHALREQASEIREFLHRKARATLPGGWFSYDLAVLPDVSIDLIATYWGGEWVERVFDVKVDGQVVASQRLRTNRPGDFFDAVYPVPPELTAGRSKITVRFEGRGGDIAGPLFGVVVRRRLMIRDAGSRSPEGSASSHR